jgi:hypothetical protein
MTRRPPLHLNVPEFLSPDPLTWFSILESEFPRHNVIEPSRQYVQLLARLPFWVLERTGDFLIRPGQLRTYETLKELVWSIIFPNGDRTPQPTSTGPAQTVHLSEAQLVAVPACPMEEVQDMCLPVCVQAQKSYIGATFATLCDVAISVAEFATSTHIELRVLPLTANPGLQTSRSSPTILAPATATAHATQRVSNTPEGPQLPWSVATFNVRLPTQPPRSAPSLSGRRISCRPQLLGLTASIGLKPGRSPLSGLTLTDHTMIHTEGTAPREPTFSVCILFDFQQTLDTYFAIIRYSAFYVKRRPPVRCRRRRLPPDKRQSCRLGSEHVTVACSSSEAFKISPLYILYIYCLRYFILSVYHYVQLLIHVCFSEFSHSSLFVLRCGNCLPDVPANRTTPNVTRTNPCC